MSNTRSTLSVEMQVFQTEIQQQNEEQKVVTPPHEEKGPISLPIVVGIKPGIIASSGSQMHAPKLCKGLLVGREDSGKSAFLTAITETALSCETSIGIDFKSKTLNGVRFQVWDTAGQERFRGITASYYRGAQFILFFGNNTADVTSRIQYAKEHNPNLNLYELVYAKQDDNRIKFSTLPFNGIDLANRITREKLPMMVSKENAFSIGCTLLSEVLQLIQCPVQAPVVEQGPKKNNCSMM